MSIEKPSKTVDFIREIERLVRKGRDDYKSAALPLSYVGTRVSRTYNNFCTIF